MPAYIDPQCYINSNYQQNDKSDIYSLGVLFWEISSGKPPFSEIPPYKINLEIVNGTREAPIKNTPSEYQQLYENCWEEEPNQRPDIDEVLKVLNQLKLQFSNNNEQNEIKISQNFSDLNINDTNSSTTTTYNDSNMENLGVSLNNSRCNNVKYLLIIFINELSLIKYFVNFSFRYIKRSN